MVNKQSSTLQIRKTGEKWHNDPKSERGRAEVSSLQHKLRFLLCHSIKCRARERWGMRKWRSRLPNTHTRPAPTVRTRNGRKGYEIEINTKSASSPKSQRPGYPNCPQHSEVWAILQAQLYPPRDIYKNFDKDSSNQKMTSEQSLVPIIYFVWAYRLLSFPRI